MNITIQKATELGISRFIPILTEYTNQSKINFQNFELNKLTLVIKNAIRLHD